MVRFSQIIKIFFVSLFIILFLYAAPQAQIVSVFEKETVFAMSAQDSVTAEQQVLLLGLMDRSFQSLADEGRRGRRIGGYVLLGLGIGSAVGGAATLAFGDGDDARIVGYSLVGGGALMSGLSLIPFKIRTEAERINQDFQQMPGTSAREVHQKYIYWDRRFGELAEKWRRERIIGGISSIVSTGIVSIAIASSSDVNDPNAYIWPAVGGFIGGISSFLIESEQERQYKIYQSSKEEILRHPQRTEVRFGMTPIPDGGLLTTIHIQF